MIVRASFVRASFVRASFVRRYAAGLLAAAALAACGHEGPPKVAAVTVSPASSTMMVGQSLTYLATPQSAKGAAITGRTVLWSSSNTAAATISTGGLVTMVAPGSSIISASSDGVTGTAQLTVIPVPVARVTVSQTSATLLVTQTLQLTAGTVDSIGGVLSGRPITWTSSAPAVATVSVSGFVVGVAPGTASIVASSEGKTTAVEITVRALSGPPVLTGLSATTLVPGQLVALRGVGFGASAAANTLTIRGIPVPLVAAKLDTLTFVAPCQNAGTAALQVTTSGGTSSALTVTFAPITRTLAKGQAVIITAADSSQCNQLQGTGTAARYVAVVSSNLTSQNSVTDFELAGNTTNAIALRTVQAPAAHLRQPLDADEARFNEAHAAHLEYERALYPQTLALARLAATRPRRARVVSPPVAGDMRSFYYNFNSCNDSTQIIRGRVVYSGTRTIVWEDSANAVNSAANPDVLSYYQKIGQIFDLDQYDVVKNTFGDPLRRDALTDFDERVHMVFTQRLNGSGAAAYVTSCDATARGTSRWGSNFGEFFYGMAPTATGTSVTNTAQPPGWFAFMVRTVVHEVKHIASLTARLSNGASAFEASWLEEGTARQAEEVWAREKLHKVAFKGNTGYGTAASNGVFCDFNLANATCAANDALRRPSWGMRRQFNEIKPKLDEPWNWSPYGDANGQSGAIFYNTTWSLVRYTLDRFGSSDAAFFTALTNGTTTGINTLTALTGVSMERLLGGWGLALYADDYPGLGTVNPDASFLTWNLRDIYGGLNADPLWTGTYSKAYPITPVALTFGSFVAQRTGIRGGAHAYFEISGTPTAPQLLDLRGVGGTTMPANLRLAIMRLQ
ncbi:MAG: Ig-like domain-containing protein [Gemmatimonadaceae bacterium]|nr:Ig-like domain-containing protein [Gemmatimonadaceae bacterium]